MAQVQQEVEQMKMQSVPENGLARWEWQGNV